MKEQTLLEMKNKIESLTRLMQHVFNETSHLRELGVGTLETLKLMPGYQDAIDELKKKMEEEVEEKKKAEQNGTSK
jgi:peptidyl-tRNA hydrolase